MNWKTTRTFTGGVKATLLQRFPITDRAYREQEGLIQTVAENAGYIGITFSNKADMLLMWGIRTGSPVPQHCYENIAARVEATNAKQSEPVAVLDMDQLRFVHSGKITSELRDAFRAQFVYLPPATTVIAFAHGWRLWDGFYHYDMQITDEGIVLYRYIVLASQFEVAVVEAVDDVVRLRDLCTAKNLAEKAYWIRVQLLGGDDRDGYITAHSMKEWLKECTP